MPRAYRARAHPRCVAYAVCDLSLAVDKDGSGSVSKVELRAFFRGSPLDFDKQEELFDSLDKDGRRPRPTARTPRVARDWHGTNAHVTRVCMLRAPVSCARVRRQR